MARGLAGVLQSVVEVLVTQQGVHLDPLTSWRLRAALGACVAAMVRMDAPQFTPGEGELSGLLDHLTGLLEDNAHAARRWPAAPAPAPAPAPVPAPAPAPALEEGGLPTSYPKSAHVLGPPPSTT